MAATELLGHDVVRRRRVNPAELALEHLGPREVLHEQHPHPPSPLLPESNSAEAAAAEDSPPPTKSAIEQDELREAERPLKPYQIPNRENGRSGSRLLGPIAMDGGGIGAAAAESSGGFGWGGSGVGKAEATRNKWPLCLFLFSGSFARLFGRWPGFVVRGFGFRWAYVGGWLCRCVGQSYHGQRNVRTSQSESWHGSATMRFVLSEAFRHFASARFTSGYMV